jgi:hypothetical protein
VVAAPGPGGSVAGGEQGVDLVVGEEGDQVAFEPLGRDGQDPLDRRRVLGVVQRGVAEQGMDCGQAVVAGAHPVAALGFQVGQERPDQRGV